LARWTEERIRDLLSGVDAIVWEAVPDTLEITFVGGPAAALSGYDEQAWRTPGFLERFIVQDDREALLALFEATSRDGTRRSLVHRVVGADGGLRRMRTRGERTRRGDAWVLVGAMLDLSEREPAEAALQRERAFSDTVLETVGAVVLVLALDGRIVRANPAAERAFGEKAETLRGRIAFDWVAPEDVPKARQALARAAAGLPLGTDYAIWLGPERARRLVMWEGTPLRNVRGEVEYVIGAGIDITERWRAEQELREREAHLRLILRQLPAIVWTADRELSLTYAAGIEVPEAPARTHGVSIYDFFGTRDRAYLPIARHLQAARGESVDYDDVRGDRIFQVHLDPFLDAEGEPAGVIGIALDVAEQRRAHASLKALIDASPLAILTVAKDRQVELWNPAAERMFGWRSQEVVGKIAPFITPDRDADFAHLHELILSGEHEGSIETVGVRRDGQVIDLSIAPARIVDETGKLLGMMAVIADVTDRKQAERALAASRERYRALVDAIDGIVWEADAEGERFSFVSRRAESLVGYPIEDWLRTRRFWLARTQPEDREALQAGLRAARDTGACELELRMVAADGRVVWLRTLARACEARRCLRGVMLDVTAQHAAEEERDRLLVQERAARRRAAFLAEASRVLSSSLDLDATLERTVRLALPEYADWCAVDVLEGDRLRQVAVVHSDPRKVDAVRRVRESTPADVHRPGGPVRRVLQGERLFMPEVTEEHLGELLGGAAPREAVREIGVASFLSVPLVARGRTLGAIAWMRGPSSPRYSEEDLALAEELAQRAAMAVENAQLYRQARDAVAARDEFLSIASHELRTPATSLQLGVQSLLRFAHRGSLAQAPPALARSMLESLERQTRRLSQLVDKLLDVSRVTSGRLELDLESVDLVEEARGVIEAFREELAATGTGLCFRAEASVVGRWDRARVTQVVTNLVSNAVKYGSGKPIEITIERRGEWGVLVIRDHGIGIPPERQELIFGRFQRAVPSRHYGGLGLGLFITRQIVLALGGRIHLESELGQGATFRVEIPLSGPRPMEAPGELPAAPPT